jgi:hypothetical protein
MGPTHNAQALPGLFNTTGSGLSFSPTIAAKRQKPTLWRIMRMNTGTARPCCSLAACTHPGTAVHTLYNGLSRWAARELHEGSGACFRLGPADQ